ncbi:MAG: transporter permease [Paenibacillaceae bacterium]|nr:transporter permease [Paenibacillaceae bacterium]
MKKNAAVEAVMPGRPLWKGITIRRSSIHTADLLFWTAVGLIALIVLCAVAPGWIAPYSPVDMQFDRILQGPSLSHLFGTDYYGKDVFSVVVHGSRDSLLIGISSVVFGGLVGSIIGALSGYIGGVLDAVLMRLIDVLMTIPGILLALAIAAALGPSLMNVIIAVSFSGIPRFARVMRGQVMSIKNRSFVLASRSIGASSARIFVKHVLSNSWSPLLVMATIGVGTSILIGSGLSFLGLGVLREVPDWGTLLSQGRGYLTVAWWISTFPGLAITLFVFSVNLIGDRLRDYLDPLQQGRVG